MKKLPRPGFEPGISLISSKGALDLSTLEAQRQAEFSCNFLIERFTIQSSHLSVISSLLAFLMVVLYYVSIS